MGKMELVVSVGVGPMEFKNLFPIYCFDVSKQNERLKASVTDITARFRFHENVKESTIAHVMI